MANNIFYLKMFLCSVTSVTRITSALVETGFSVTPHVSGKKTHIEGKHSTFLSLKLETDKESRDTAQKVSQFLDKVFHAIDAPHFGYTLGNASNTECIANTGYLPDAKPERKASPIGPFRPMGDVISI